MIVKLSFNKSLQRPLCRTSFNQILCLFFLSMMVIISPVQANEENTKTFESEFAVLTENNLPDYVSEMSARYYEQLELLKKYFQLYQQKRDPRGFNVWHLRGFSPNFNKINDENQRIASANEAFLSEQPEKALATIFAELKEVSVNLMVTFRDNDPHAFKAAVAQVKSHNQQIATLLRLHDLEIEVREISLN